MIDYFVAYKILSDFSIPLNRIQLRLSKNFIIIMINYVHDPFYTIFIAGYFQEIE